MTAGPEMHFVPATEEQLADCANEPIHIPGAIQPHGMLLAVTGPELTITHVSANIEAFAGITPQDALGRSLVDILGAKACTALLQAISGERYSPANVLSLSLPLPVSQLSSVLAHVNEDQIIVEIEDHTPDPEPDSAIIRAQSIIANLRRRRSLTELCNETAREIRSLTRYDRVMLYRFDPDGHGQVIAEDLKPGLEPYLGLHFPATDIPAQARRLYLLQRIRVIQRIDYEPVPVIGHGRPLNMTYASLRSVSPVHLEYLRNMGVAATLAISIICDQKLWGMVVCHHGSPFAPSPGLRAHCDLLGQLIGLLIGELEERDMLSRKLKTQEYLTAIAQQIESGGSTVEGLSEVPEPLLQLMNANGAYIRLGSTGRALGNVPPGDAAPAILTALRARNGDEMTTIDNLGAILPEFDGLSATVSGAMLLPIVNNAGDGIVWFRPEHIRAVDWGGDPLNKAQIDQRDGRLTPRKSFTAWREIRRGQSAPWTALDEQCGHDLRRIITKSLLRRTEAELVRVYNSDPLTGLANRRVLNERLAAWRKAGSGTASALMFLDLDRFKTLNDSLGHYAGDDLLQEVARRLSMLITDEQLLVRLGGDEFVIFCEHLGEADATGLAGRILQLFEAAFVVDGRPHQCTASIGIAFGTADSEDLLREADAAMYAAKRLSGNRFMLFQSNLHQKAMVALRTEQDLFMAISRNEFVLHFQPIVRLADHVTTAFEALIRWNHPERGLLPPAAFIRLAEETGLIVRIGRWVAGQVIKTLASVDDQKLVIGFNVSVQQLLQGGFATEIGEMLLAANVPASRLVIEVTESTLMEDEALRELHLLNGLGCRVAIDDFGTGYSSLAYLHRLPVDTIKIDHSFVTTIEDDPRARHFLSAIIGFAATLGLRIVAEGVETAGQRDILAALDCAWVQGFLFGRPLPIEMLGLTFKPEPI